MIVSSSRGYCSEKPQRRSRDTRARHGKASAHATPKLFNSGSLSFFYFCDRGPRIAMAVTLVLLWAATAVGQNPPNCNSFTDRISGDVSYDCQRRTITSIQASTFGWSLNTAEMCDLSHTLSLSFFLSLRSATRRSASTAVESVWWPETSSE